MSGREYMQTKVASTSDLQLVKQQLGKRARLYVSMGNQIFVSRGNQPALNLFWRLKLAVCVKGCLCDWESYVSLSNVKYPSFISIHQSYIGSSSWPFKAICVLSKCKTHYQRAVKRTPQLRFTSGWHLRYIISSVFKIVVRCTWNLPS